MRQFLVAATLAMLAFAGTALAAPAKTADSAKGKMLTDAKGMTLYIFDKDTGGKPACAAACPGKWPPLSRDYRSPDAPHSSGMTVECVMPVSSPARSARSCFPT